MDSEEIISLSWLAQWSYGGGEILENENNGIFADGHYWWYAKFVEWDEETKIGWVMEDAIEKNNVPKASFTFSNNEPKAGEEILIDASDSYDPDGNIIYYSWDLDGDGEFDGDTTSPKIYYYWDKGGTYNVKLKVTDNNGAESKVFSREISVRPYSWWERFKNFLSSKVKGLSKRERRRFEIIKSELHIINLGHSDNRWYDPDFDWIGDDELLMVLKKKIDPEASDLTYEAYILDTLHDMELVDSIARPSFSTSPAVEKYFENIMAKVNGWAVASKLLLKLLEKTLKHLMKGKIIGITPILYLPELCKVGIGLELLDQTIYRRSLWFYFQNRSRGDDPDKAFKAAPIQSEYTGEKKEKLKRYFEHLWQEYGGSHISNSGGLKSDFKEQIIEQLRNLLLSGIEKYKFEFYHIKSPGEIRVYDSQGRVTGLVNGEIKEEIPNSAYDDGTKTVLIYPATDFYRCEVAGTKEGTYGLEVTSVESGEATTFTATDVPTKPGAIHDYTVNWDALKRGEGGVTVQVDSDGDGRFEKTVSAGSGLGGTRKGSNVKVEFPDQGVTLVFNNVTAEGITGLAVSSEPPFGPLPGIRFISKFYRLTTSATHTGNITLTIHYDDAGLTPAEESSLRLFKITKDTEVHVTDITTSLDPENNLITGTTKGFSYFAVGTSSAPPAPVISSSTHPEQTKWYKNNDPLFSWAEPESPFGIKGYSYILDHKEDTVPDTIIDTTETTKSYTDLEEGTWYFHVRAQDGAGNWGPAGHYKINIDTTPPVISDVLPIEGDFVPAKPTVSATLTDNLSGIDETSIVLKLNGEEVEASPSFDPETGRMSWTWQKPLADGTYTLTIEVEDKAGNKAKPATTSFVISTELAIRNAVNYPNPCSSGTTFTYNLSQEAQVRIEIYTLAGELIKVIEPASGQVGYNEQYWDGTDDRGYTLGNGVYIYRIVARANGKTVQAIGKLVILR